MSYEQNWTQHVVLGIAVLMGTLCAAAEAPNGVDGARIRFADTVAFGPINVGMWAKVTVLDVDGDGGQDLLVAGGGHGGGAYLFRDPGLKDGERIYSRAQKLDLENVGFRAVVFYGEDRCGLLYVHENTLMYRSPATKRRDLFAPPEVVMGKTGKPFAPGGNHVYPIPHGDRVDLLIGRETGDYWPSPISAWGNRAAESGVGLFRSYNESGEWRGGRMRGFLYIARDEGKGGRHRYTDPVRLQTQSGRPLEVYGNPSAIVADWDQDGDWDILSADFIDYLTYFENIGTADKPIFLSGRKIVDPQGNIIHMPQNITMPERINWRGAGREDLVVAQEDGRVYALLRRGFSGSRLPLFSQPEVILQRKPCLEAGIMAVPSAVDWDRDGQTDLLVGNAAGYVEWFRNLGTDANPAFDLPVRLEADGFPLRIQGGYRGSIQGPNEKKWGYTCPCVTDWDGDGYPDLILCGILGDHIFYRNSRGDSLREIEQGRSLTVNGAPLRTRWRVRPVAIALRKGDLPSYLCLDTEGYLALHERDMARGITALRPGRRLLYQDGGPMKLDGEGGHEGRAKLAAVDWDEDGDWDLLCGLKGDQPLVYSKSKLSRIIYFENVGTTDEPQFMRPRYILSRKTGHLLGFGNHSCAPFAVRLFGDRVPGLLVGTEGGSLFYWSRPMISIAEKPIQVN